MNRFSLSLCVLIFLFLVPRPAAAQGLAATRLAAVQTYLTELEEIASWCEEVKLYKSRDETYAAILRISPDNEVARDGLKYVRDQDGNWKQGRYKEPANHDAELVPECASKLAQAKARFTDRLLTALEATDDKQEPQSYKLAIADVLAVDPDNLRARNLNGEDRLNGKWVLLETTRSLKRSDELRDLAKDVLGEIPDPQDSDVTDVEKDYGVSFRSALQGQRWRGVGTVPEAELRKAVKTLDAAAPFFSQLFGVGSEAPGGDKTFYLLKGASEADKCLTKHPAFDETRRKYLLTLKAAWVPGGHVFFQWNDSAQLRLDGATRNALSLLIIRCFGMSTKEGWAWEGLGLYMDYLLSGSRRTIYVSNVIQTTTEKMKKLDIDRRMRSPGADWLKLAYEMLDAAVEPDLRSLVLMDVNDMSAEDLVYSYALVSFVLEGNAQHATEFFVRMGTGVQLADVVERIFDKTYLDWQKRFERWLRERATR